MAYALPSDAGQWPATIDGAGTLGRRIAAVYAAAGSDVRIFDVSAGQRQAARGYVAAHISGTQQALGLHPERAGRVEVTDRLQDAVADAWMVIEALPENAGLKTEVFGDLDRLAEADAILASNSSSLPSSQLIGKVEHPERVLNTHYQQPPELNCVELMSCGRTDPGVIDALMSRIPRYGLKVGDHIPDAPERDRDLEGSHIS
jgi:3-hydroxybutyryl-CoA dehydrogenase